DNVSFTPSQGTVTYTVTADLNGCTATSSITVIVNPSPTVSANANLPSPLCEGDQLTLSGSPAGGAIYTWDNGVTDNISFTPSQGTVTYTVTADLNGCTSTDNITITVNPAPTVVANANPLSPLCEGDQLTLSGSPSGGAIYTWDNGVTDNVSFTPSQGTVTYTVTADLNGCTATDNITVTVNPSPTVVSNANPLSPLCEGDQLTLSGSGTAGSTYTWDNGVTDNVSFTPSVGTVTYTVTADLNGCIATSSITMIVNPAPITGPINHW
ncbi:MAG: hypothetical protein ACKVJA_02330, partial [Flavobacteriales bacterium]